MQPAKLQSLQLRSLIKHNGEMELSLQRAGADTVHDLKKRVAAEIKTTFASQYSAEISLAETLHPDFLAAYRRRATGQKYLINPNKGL